MAQRFPTPEETLKAHKKVSAQLRKQIKHEPEKARAFFIEAGILVKSKSTPSGVELHPRLRPGG